MEIKINEDISRKIATKEHNIHVQVGFNNHERTLIAPSVMLEPLSDEVQNRINERYTSIENIIIKKLGKPFYSESGFILYCGDCTEFLETLKGSDLKVNLTVTSPPYNIGKEYETKTSVESYVNWCSKWISQVYDLTSDTGSFWLNLGYFEVPNKCLCVPIPYLLWDKSPFYMLQEIVWQYGAGVASKRRLSPRNEKWVYYAKNPLEYTFNLDDIRDPNVKYPNQKKNGKYRCNPLGKNPSDVWEIPKVTTGINRSSKERTGHPAQFPLAVVERIILASSNQTELILDPFAGSCSVGVASLGLGRLFLGFEARSDYCEMAVERFRSFNREKDKSKLQQKLL